MQAVSTKGTEDDGHWLTYWIVFSLLNILDFAQARGMSPGPGAGAAPRAPHESHRVAVVDAAT